MLPLVIVLAVIAVVAGAWGVTRSQAASSAQARGDALDERVKALDADLAAARDRVAAAGQAAQQADQRAAQEAQRAEQAEKDGRRSDEMAEDAVKRAIAAERVAADAVERAELAETASAEAVKDRDATLAGAGPFQPEALWSLEVQRIERLWRDRLALQPHEPSPLAADPYDLGAAMRILSEASREESGVVVDLMWHVDFECPADRCVQLTRLGEEIIAAMRDSEGGELEIIGEEDRTVFFLVRTLPPIELPERLTAVLDGFGAMRELADSTVVVRVPARDEAKIDAAVGPGSGSAGEVIDLIDGEPSAAAAPLDTAPAEDTAPADDAAPLDTAPADDTAPAGS